MMKAILFDFGGTLDVPARHWASVLWEAYQHYEVPITEAQFREAYVAAERGLALKGAVDPQDNLNILLHKKVERQAEALVQAGHWRAKAGKRALISESIAAYCHDLVVAGLDERHEVLSRLHEHYKLIIVSNFYGNLRSVLADYDLLPYFHAVIESAAVGVRKPQPEIWAMGIEAAGYPAAQCWAVGDSYRNDIAPAASLGCPTIWLKGETWGETPTDALPATHTISNLSNLSELLLP